MKRRRITALRLGLATAGLAGVFAAHGMPAPPGVDVASLTQLRTHGPILELGSDRRVVGAIVGESRAGCEYVIAWRAGTRSVFRFSGFGTDWTCGDPVSHRALLVTRTIVSWNETVQGASCGVFDAQADLARGARRTLDHDEEVVDGACFDHVFRRIGPSRQRERGVEMTFKRRLITLRRDADRRMRTIQAPARVVDAELEAEGLFYAYNVRARFAGRLVFIPFARLFP